MNFLLFIWYFYRVHKVGIKGTIFQKKWYTQNMNG